MARYNHFGKAKYTGVMFGDIPVGHIFGKGGDTYSTHEKTGDLQYRSRKTGEVKKLFGSNFTVYIKPLPEPPQDNK